MENKIVCKKCGAKENITFSGKKTPIQAIIRTKDVCDVCFSDIKRDNERFVNEGKNIPKTLITRS